MVLFLCLCLFFKSSTYLGLFFPSVLVVYAYFNSKKHVLNMLLYLEFATMMSMLYLFFGFQSSGSVLLLMLIFFTLSVCEACVGISILIKLSRNSGNDKLKFIS